MKQLILTCIIALLFISCGSSGSYHGPNEWQLTQTPDSCYHWVSKTYSSGGHHVGRGYGLSVKVADDLQKHDRCKCSQQ